MFITIEELQDHPVGFDEVLAAGLIDYATEGLRQAAPLHVKGTASLIEREIHMRGSLSTEVHMECARCLEPLVQPVKRDFDLYYVPLEDRPKEDERPVLRGEEELG